MFSYTPCLNQGYYYLHRFQYIKPNVPNRKRGINQLKENTSMPQVAINSIEDAFNQLFLWPQIIAIARSVSETIDTPNTSEFLTV